MSDRRFRPINSGLSPFAKAEDVTISGAWTFTGLTTFSQDVLLDGTAYLSVQGGAADQGQVGQIAFVDIAGGVGRFGSYNWDTLTYQPVQLVGSTVSISGTTVNMNPTGNINVNPTGQFQLLSGNTCRTYNAGNTAYSELNSTGLYLIDGVTAPGSTSGFAKIYVDTADGDLKVIFGDGTIKTLATDT